MCRDTLLVYLLLHLAVWGLFRPKKNIVLVPCSALYPCLGTPSLSDRGRRGGGGGGGDTMAYTETLRQN